MPMCRAILQVWNPHTDKLETVPVILEESEFKHLTNLWCLGEHIEIRGILSVESIADFETKELEPPICDQCNEKMVHRIGDPAGFICPNCPFTVC